MIEDPSVRMLVRELIESSPAPPPFGPGVTISPAVTAPFALAAHVRRGPLAVAVAAVTVMAAIMFGLVVAQYEGTSDSDATQPDPSPIGYQTVGYDAPIGSVDVEIPQRAGPPTSASFPLVLRATAALDIQIESRTPEAIASTFCACQAVQDSVLPDGRVLMRWGSPGGPVGASPELLTAAVGTWTLVMQGPDIAKARTIATTLRLAAAPNGVHLLDAGPYLRSGPSPNGDVILLFVTGNESASVSLAKRCDNIEERNVTPTATDTGWNCSSEGGIRISGSAVAVHQLNGLTARWR